MVSWADSPLNQKQANVVACSWDEIVQHLAPPTETWGWRDSGFSHGTLTKLAQEGLIEQTPAGDWRTSEDLWLDVIDRAADEETIGGDAVEQETRPDHDVGDVGAARRTA